MTLKEQFDKAAADIHNLKLKPSDDDLLEIYGFYKQATIGDNATDKPGFFDFKGKAKWEAWNSQKGKSADEAMQEYVKKVELLIRVIGLKEEM